MRYHDDSKEAADYLRKAVPLMVENKIPPHPINYTLWYNYVGGKTPELNTAIDERLNQYGGCDEVFNEQIYFKFFIGEDLEKHRLAVESLTKMATGLLTQVDHTAEESDNFNQTLQENLNQLNEAKSLSETLAIIDNVVATTNDIHAANQRFNASLHQAQEEIDALKRELELTRHDAYHDPLTQLNNRLAFNQQLNKAIISGGKTTALILVDVDHFKSFNDQYGHLIGDRVLQTLAEVLVKSCPDNATPARYGGEEFAIIVSNSSMAEAEALSEKVRKRLQGLQVKIKSSDKVIDHITASFGVAMYAPEESMEDLIHRADEALYRAKQNGRNRVEKAA